jgi:hypothetical protein
MSRLGMLDGSTFTENAATVLLMNKRFALAMLRLAFGVLVFITLIAQVIYLHQHNALDLFDFFSYFTILSNVFAAFTLIIGSFYLLKKRKPTHSEDVIRGAAVLYMTVTGIVYATLLSGQSLGLLLPWVNDVLHRIMPLVVIVDWLYQPVRSKLQVKQIPLLFIFPIVYLAYTLIRGPIAGWYPYPFLNPTKAGGYIGVALYSVGILILFYVLSRLLVYSGNKLKRHVH